MCKNRMLNINFADCSQVRIKIESNLRSSAKMATLRSQIDLRALDVIAVAKSEL